jgi:hypothetical protein
MYAKLVLQPWAKNDRLLVVWDNCTSHVKKEVVDFYRELNIEIAFLPRNMTDKLQPMDLVVNGPLKADMRRARCEQVYDYFQSFVNERKKDPTKRFLPPLLQIPDALFLIRNSVKKLFESETFKESIRKCFIKVGLAPDPNLGGNFRKYTGKNVVSNPDEHATTLFDLLEQAVIGPEPDEEEIALEEDFDFEYTVDEFGEVIASI